MSGKGLGATTSLGGGGFDAKKDASSQVDSMFNNNMLFLTLQSKVQNVGNLVINILTVVASVVGVAACIVAGMKYFSGDPHARDQVKGIAIGAFFSFAAAGIVQALKAAIG